VCVAVATQAGPQFPLVLEQPWALTLWTYHQLGEKKRIDDLIERIDAVNVATLNALAFNEPQKLGAERERALDAAKERPREASADADWRERARRLVDAIETGKVLD